MTTNTIPAVGQGTAPVGVSGVSPEMERDDEARTWEAFQAAPMDAAMFLRLLTACDFRAAEAAVLWDILVFHRRSGLQSFAVRSGVEYPNTYGEAFSVRSSRRAIQSLSEQGLIEQAAVVRNVSKKFRLNWGVLWAAISQVSPLVPGLGSVPAL